MDKSNATVIVFLSTNALDDDCPIFFFGVHNVVDDARDSRRVRTLELIGRVELKHLVCRQQHVFRA